jgi:hypothetical protein
MIGQSLSNTNESVTMLFQKKIETKHGPRQKGIPAVSRTLTLNFVELAGVHFLVPLQVLVS